MPEFDEHELFMSYMLTHEDDWREEHQFNEYNLDPSDYDSENDFLEALDEAIANDDYNFVEDDNRDYETSEYVAGDIPRTQSNIDMVDRVIGTIVATLPIGVFLFFTIMGAISGSIGAGIVLGLVFLAIIYVVAS